MADSFGRAIQVSFNGSETILSCSQGNSGEYVNENGMLALWGYIRGLLVSVGARPDPIPGTPFVSAQAVQVVPGWETPTVVKLSAPSDAPARLADFNTLVARLNACIDNYATQPTNSTPPVIGILYGRTHFTTQAAFTCGYGQSITVSFIQADNEYIVELGLTWQFGLQPQLDRAIENMGVLEGWCAQHPFQNTGPQWPHPPWDGANETWPF